jgi:predicted nucleic acid-binding Zn ribbon protein
MTQKTLGYVELEWTCKRCGTKNLGTLKTCSNCGAAMGEEEKFDVPAQQELITDQKKLEEAQKGPDVHCPFCGTRNPAGAKECSQCGGDLKDAQARQQGQVMGAFTAQAAPEIPCPSCGTPNPANATRCQNCGGSLAKQEEAAAPKSPPVGATPAKSNRVLWIVVAVVIVLACLGSILFLVLGARTKAHPATVQSVEWERSINLLEQQPVEHKDWRDEIPAGADVGTCTQEYRRTQSEPAPGAEEVCGTPYSVDQGSGVAKVVQDCQYRIYDDYCAYTQMEWVVVNTAYLQGNDINPIWPAIVLSTGRREGERSESYTVVFRSDGETYTYQPSDPQEFSGFAPGSEWILDVNTFGTVTDVRER